MPRHFVIVATLFPLLASCDAPNGPTTNVPVTSEAPTDDYAKIVISGNIPDVQRQAIVLERVERDVHEIASSYPDMDLRILLEVIAGDSGVHPARIDLDNGLKNPPISFDDLDVVELILTIEDMFGATISDQEMDQDFQNPSPHQLLLIIKARKTK